MLKGRSTSHAYLVNVNLVCCSNYCLKHHPLVTRKWQAKLQWKALMQFLFSTQHLDDVPNIRNHNTQQTGKEAVILSLVSPPHPIFCWTLPFLFS